MKIYLRLFQFAQPIGQLIIPYVTFSLLSILFGLFNLTLLIPLLNILFGTTNQPNRVAVSQPEFNWDLNYFGSLFNFYFDQLLITYGALGTLKVICLIIITSVLLTNVFRYLAQRIIEYLRTKMVYQLRGKVYEKLISFSVRFFTNERRGDIMSRLTADVQEVESTIAHTFSVLLKEPLQLISYFIALFVISPPLTLFTLIVLPISGIFIAFLVKKLKESSRQGQSSLGKLLSIVDETLHGVKIIKAFNGAAYFRHKFDQENQNYARLTRYISYRRELASPFSEFMGVTIVVIILLYGGSLILSDESALTASQFLTYIALFTQITKPAKDLSTAFSNVQRGLAAGERVLELIDKELDQQDHFSAVPLPPFSEAITFQQVSFAYGDSPVLKDISLSIPKGKTVALVGPSGGGKSTIADLIPRFYDVKEGSILIDGKDIREYTLDSLRSQMGIVTQEPILFNDTIFNNIAFGQTEAREEDVIRAAKIANAHDFILQTADGYQTVIGDRGSKLSGGQRQRIAIARAVLKNPPILILDEATSALDTESEKLVQEALGNLMKGRTTLVIAHRLSTIQQADEIIVIQQGRIAEQGSHEGLLQLEKGVYRRLTAMQLG